MTIWDQKISIGFDPNLFTERSLFVLFGKNKFKLKPISQNLIDVIWRRSIIKNRNKFYSLPKKAIGESYKLKIGKIDSRLNFLQNLIKNMFFLFFDDFL